MNAHTRLIHSAVVVSSESAAILVFEKVFCLKAAYSFQIESETMQTLFNLNCSATARIYDAGNCRIEVFIINPLPANGAVQHICLAVPDRNAVISQARLHGLMVRRWQRADSEVVFLVDADKNLYEIKELPANPELQSPSSC